MATAHKQGKDILTDIEKSGSDHANSPLSKSMDFINETRYVMLNFMRLVPPENHASHIVSSPQLSNDQGNIFKSSIISSMLEMECIDEIDAVDNLDYYDEADAIDYVCGVSVDRDINENQQNAPDIRISTADGPRKLADGAKLQLNIQIEELQLDELSSTLQTELNNEMEEESEYEGKRFPGNSPVHTPQIDAAVHFIAHLGDKINEQFGDHIAAAVSQLTDHPIENLTYSKFRQVAKTVVVSNVLGWRQVAFYMVFGQKVIYGALKQGHKQIGNILDYLSQLVADEAADFIIREGGWGSVMNIDPNQCSDDSPLDFTEYLNKCNVTEVKSSSVECKVQRYGAPRSAGPSIENGSGEIRNGINCHSRNKAEQEFADVEIDYAESQSCIKKQIFMNGATQKIHFDPNVSNVPQRKPKYKSSVDFDFIPGSLMEDEVLNLFYNRTNGQGHCSTHEETNDGVFQSLDQTENVNGKFEEINAQSRIKMVARGTRSEHLWNILIHIRKMGPSVLAVTLAVLALGVGARLAVQSRK